MCLNDQNHNDLMIFDIENWFLKSDLCNFWVSEINKPKRVFGLQVRWRDLDTFKIFEKFFGNFLDFFGNFLGGFFWRNFSGGFVWEKFFRRIFLGGFFGRNYLVENNKELMFCQDFEVILSQWKEERRKNCNS